VNVPLIELTWPWQAYALLYGSLALAAAIGLFLFVTDLGGER